MISNTTYMPITPKFISLAPTNPFPNNYTIAYLKSPFVYSINRSIQSPIYPTYTSHHLHWWQLKSFWLLVLKFYSHSCLLYISHSTSSSQEILSYPSYIHICLTLQIYPKASPFSLLLILPHWPKLPSSVSQIISIDSWQVSLLLAYTTTTPKGPISAEQSDGYIKN